MQGIYTKIVTDLPISQFLGLNNSKYTKIKCYSTIKYINKTKFNSVFVLK